MKMGPDRKGLSKKYILSAVEDSLRRLQTDYIDLYQAHEDDPETPQEETLGAFDRLVRAGKVRLIGASNFSAERLTGALGISRQHGYPVYQSLQPRYNLYHRDEFEGELEALCLKEKIGVITYSSLASGFLTGKYRSKADLGKSPRGARAGEKFNERGYRILDALDQVAKERNSTPTTIALAWLLARPSVTAPIVSATGLGQLKELIAAMDLQLSSPILSQLTLASA
jgi:aryl-alcohol dehydrogenase-like predicted oxidoreductase